VDLGFVLNIGAFTMSDETIRSLQDPDRPHSHIDTTVRTATFEVPGTVERGPFEAWLGDILWEHDLPRDQGESSDGGAARPAAAGAAKAVDPNGDGDRREVIRMKGVLSLAGEDRRCIVQAVYVHHHLSSPGHHFEPRSPPVPKYHTVVAPPPAHPNAVITHAQQVRNVRFTANHTMGSGRDSKQRARFYWAKPTG
jgi:G3E family GTPase